jgi:arginyl-tRNA synthetase
MPLPLAREIAASVALAAGVDEDVVVPMLGEPPQAAMGDYSLPCFKLAPMLKKDPKKLAQEIVSQLSASDVIAEAKAMGPYVNVKVLPAALAKAVLGDIDAALAAGRPYAASGEGAGKTVVIEYSSPNIAKPFGIGHLRTTVIGNSLVKLYAAAGYKVVRLNYPGDWGTQFGFILGKYKEKGDDDRLAKEGVSYLVELYQEASAQKADTVAYDAAAGRVGPVGAADATATYADVARNEFKKLEDGDAENLALWTKFREASLAEFQRIYDLLDVSFDSLDGEAATRPLIPDAIAELEKHGLLVESDGAMVVELGLGDNVPPAMIRKSDGATTYLARDLAAVLERYRKHEFERCVYVVGRDQELHFRQLFRLLELMGIKWADRCVHVPFGMIRFGGGKMRTREKGKSVLLEDVLNRAFEEVGKIVESRQKGVDLDEAEQKAVDHAVAIGAVIFADLSRKRIKDFDFDWDTAFSLDGDSGPYLQYSHARSAGIIKKSGRDVSKDVDLARLDDEAERNLLKTLGKYPVVVGRAREENEPSVVGAHIVEIGRALNLFYNRCRVLGEERALEDARLLLVWATKTVLREALSMLGISAPESM